MSLPAPERWAAFLRQIEERHGSLLEEATQAVREALPSCNYDPLPLRTAWTTLDHRLQELERRIGDTWNDKVEATFDAENYPVDKQLVELQRGRDLTHELENRRLLREASLFADVARQLYAVSVATQKEHLCPQCGAPLQVPLTYRALDVRCSHCGALTLFEPGTLARNVVVFGAHPIATEASAREWIEMRAAERRQHAGRPPIPLELLKAYERAQIAYWFRYISAKLPLEPELSNVPHEVRSRMEQWYTMVVEYEPAWIAAGRPRERIG
ncbi:MAG TPA: hypothetical protein VGK73_03120 [Polyangiaceae bacterium]